MKKYKLIKEYPGSPKLGIEVNYSDTHKIYNYNSGNFYSELPKHQVENLPEFWKPVEEPEFEILQFKNNIDGYIFERNHGRFMYPVNHFLNHPETFIITKIIRLSDGEIFSIGEKVNFQGNGCSGKHIINSFELDTNGIMIVKASVVHFPLKYIEKLKQPLFTTEDGVDMFEGDTIWAVENDNVFDAKVKPREGKYWNIIYDGKCKLFSTEEAAQDYINNNKPRYSKKEIRNALNKYRFDFGVDGRQMSNQIMEDLDIC